jgi:hypothetical protein
MNAMNMNCCYVYGSLNAPSGAQVMQLRVMGDNDVIGRALPQHLVVGTEVNHDNRPSG